MKNFIFKQLQHRDCFSVCISLCIHIIIFLGICASGFFQYRYGIGETSEIVFFSAGSNSGGSASVNNKESKIVGDNNSATSGIDNADKCDHEIISSNAISDNPQNKVSASLKTNNIQSPNSVSNLCTGVGKGEGNGSGCGNGDSTGSGDGMGSGMGNSIVKQPTIPPKIKYTVSPAYPLAQKQAGIEGLVILQLIIAVNGTVESTTITQSSGNMALDNAAQQAALRWKFTPARNRNGERVRCYYKLPMRFSLQYS